MPRGSAAGRESKQTRMSETRYPFPLASRQLVKTFYEDVWADLPADPEPWAWERRRTLLLNEARAGERVLDLGCGAGRFIAALRDAGADPVGVELAEAALEPAGRHAPGAEMWAGWPRRRSTARAATSRAPICGRSSRTARCRSSTRASTSCGARRCSSTL